MARGDAVQGRGASQGNSNTQLQKDFDRIREKVEKLTGERGDATKSLSAIRRGELSALGSLTMLSSQIGVTPTQADFNALQSDVATIFEALSLISNRLGNATIPKV